MTTNEKPGARPGEGNGFVLAGNTDLTGSPQPATYSPSRDCVTPPSETVGPLERLYAAFPVFREHKPLAIGVYAAVREYLPDTVPGLVRQALARHTGRRLYGLDGTPSGEGSEAHRVAAVLCMARPTKARRNPVLPAAATRRENPSPASASAFEIGAPVLRRPA